MKLIELDIKQASSAVNFAKGKEYYKYGMVKELNIVNDNDLYASLTSRVSGSNEDDYFQSIEMYRKWGKLSLHGNCTCPVRFNCKHVIASTLTYVLKPKKVDPLELINQWIKKIKIAAITQEHASANIPEINEQVLIYRIYDQEKKTSSGDVHFLKTKQGKSGKYNKGTSCTAQNVLGGHYFTEIINEDDRLILGLLQGLHEKWSTRIFLKGTLGHKALNMLIQTNRCFFSQNDTPLQSLSDIHTISFAWEADDLEHSRLVCNLTEDHYLAPTHPMMLINARNNTIQPIESSLDYDTVALMLKAPVIANVHLGEVYEKLSSIAALPAPAGYDIVNIDSTFVPHLRLLRHITSEKTFHSLCLTFSYSGYSVEPLPFLENHRITKNGSRVEISRDRNGEMDAIKLLETFGFTQYPWNKQLHFLSDPLPSTQVALERWNTFLSHHRTELEAKGWIVEVDESFAMSFEQAEGISVLVQEKNDWFSLSFDLEFGGSARPLVPLLASIIAEFDHYEALPAKINIEIEENRFVTIDKTEMEPILKTIFELFEKKTKEGTFELNAYESHLIGDLDENVIWKGSREILELSSKLRDLRAIEKVTPPKALNASLRQYQLDGLDWLGFLHDFRFGGILADDMGLGKTIQTLAHLSRLKEEGKLTKPSLIVMPTSLIANWRNEANRFTPNLSVLILHGSDRNELFGKIEEYDLILTTYPLIVRDSEVLGVKKFAYIILDEAQKIKNPKTQMAISIKGLSCDHRLALSGTPIENHLGELWSIFSFLMPGFLGSQSFFREFYQNPIEKERDMKRQEQFNRRIKPFMLRRTKEAVVLELPAKSEIIKYTQFEPKQAKLYESIRVTMEEKVREAINAKGLGKSHITILDALLKLRQVCCDPSLLTLEEAKKVKESAKLELLMDLLDELLQEGRKILLFSQFTSMLKIIEDRLVANSINFTKLTGETKKREEAIERFTRGEADVFLISLKAGGVGLNLTEADTVIHYDPWWNPAVENQATDRAHRIGQTKAVFVYKLIVENSIEQKILELQKRKQAIQNIIYEGEHEDENVSFKGEELIELLMS
jgi:superfamily II DNA or RNA helicase